MTAADLEQLCDQHAQALFGFLLNLTRCDSDTRDLLQDLFCKVAANPITTF
jgi:DNA-directed RNA polymerase specialized sigma24 family protein